MNDRIFSNIILISLLALSSHYLMAESNNISNNGSDDAKYLQDALKCQKDAQLTHEIKIDVGQSKEAVRIPSEIDKNLYSVCMESLGHKVDISDDKFLNVHAICQEKAQARTSIEQRDNSIYIEAPDLDWYQACYRNGGIVVDVIESQD